MLMRWVSGIRMGSSEGGRSWGLGVVAGAWQGEDSYQWGVAGRVEDLHLRMQGHHLQPGASFTRQ